jgi:hypothetical protein
MSAPYSQLESLSKADQRVYVEQNSAVDLLVQMLLDADLPAQQIITYFGDTDPLAADIKESLFKLEFTRSVAVRARMAAEDSIIEALQFSERSQNLSEVDLLQVASEAIKSLEDIDPVELVNRAGKKASV